MSVQLKYGKAILSPSEGIQKVTVVCWCACAYAAMLLDSYPLSLQRKNHRSEIHLPVP